MPNNPRIVSHATGGRPISSLIPQTSTPYLLSEEGGSTDDDDSDFSFEIEEEITQKKARTNDDRLPMISQPLVTRDAHNSKINAEQKMDAKKPSSNIIVTYTALSVQKDDDDDMSFEESITSDDDFSISVASETDELVKDSTNSARKSAVKMMQPVNSWDGRADVSNTSSKTNSIQSFVDKLSTNGNKPDCNSLPPQQVFAVTKQCQQSDDVSTTSSRVQSLRSKAASSIEFAQSIVKSHGDIESGTFTGVSTSNGKLKKYICSYGDGTNVSTPSSKQSSRRKMRCIVGFVLVAAAITGSALIALDIRQKEKSKPTSEAETNNDYPWYVDWNKYQCVMNCNGPNPCGGTKMTDDDTFSTLKECCSVGMATFIDEHWTLDMCMEMTSAETMIPTFSPSPDKKDDSYAPTTGHLVSLTSRVKPSKPTPRPNKPSKPTSPAQNTGEDETEALYYPDYGERNCIKEDVSSRQSWDKGFDTKDECCDVNFSWDRGSVCFGGGEEISTALPKTVLSVTTSLPTIAPTIRPTLRPITSSPTRSPTKKPTLPPSKKPTSSPIIPGSPTRSPVISPTMSPSTFPTSSPTLLPTHKPSTKPTGVPIGPTPSPTGQLELLRAMLVTRSPKSTDNLFLESSVQYQAMEWLVGNSLYDSYPDDRKVQRWALTTFYYSLYGGEWTVDNGWVNIDGDLENECTWHGISCTEAGTVMSINLNANKVYGNVPDETSLLVDVEYLELSENEIKSIPASLIGLPKLLVLDLYKNRLQQIPVGDYGSSILEELYLSYNGISSIPDVFFQLRFVKVLWLAHNKISSTLTGFGKMILLEELDLESNQFQGSIPEEMFGLVNLASLYLYDNELTGQFPQGLSKITSLTELDLHSNNIEGTLPTEIGKFSTLSKLYLGNNKIMGQIPTQLFGLTKLTVLDISENYLNSTIGSGIGNLDLLTQLYLHENYKKGNNGEIESYGIYGTIPESIGSLTLLKQLRLDNNYVEGMLPVAIGELQSLEILRLESNNLYGSIKSITNAKNLRYVHLWSNYFTDTISNSIGQLSQVVELFLDDNELTGFIPSEMGLLANATYISLGFNKLEGMIPTSFGMLSTLERLDLQDNSLSGEIPKELGNIKSLKMIRLEGNQFFGDIPEKVCSLKNLDVLSGDCAIAADNTTDNSYWWSCSCCTVCDKA